MVDAVAVNRVAIDALSKHHDSQTAVRAALIGVALLFVLTVVVGCAWRRSRVRETLALAALGAVCVALASYVAWNPNAGSATCPGRTDCDIGYGLGAVVLAAALFVPMSVTALLGRWLRRLVRIR